MVRINVHIAHYIQKQVELGSGVVLQIASYLFVLLVMAWLDRTVSLCAMAMRNYTRLY